MNSNNHILNLADQCVKCGMCLPHCPTYGASQLESESPRGRIAIIQGLITHKIDNTQKALAHIDNCLTCRACEKICPSAVSYGELLDQFKSKTHGMLVPPQKRLLKSAIRLILLNPKLISLILHWVKLFNFENFIGIPKKLKTNTRIIYQNNKTRYQTSNLNYQSKKNTVGLFIGCTGSSFDKQTLNDSILVLNALGFNVKISQAVKCCGALDSHAGHEQAAMNFAKQNIKLFNDSNVDHIVYFASGCGAQLSEYHKLNWNSTEQQQQAKIFCSKLSEITQFIHQHWPDTVAIKKSPRTIAIHEPCTHRNVLKESEIGFKLLSRVEGITVIRLTENKFCCGAAGDYMMTHKTMANKLRSPKLKEINQLKPELVLTTNVGCALHLRKGLHSDKQTVAVKHPVSFIAELLMT